MIRQLLCISGLFLLLSCQETTQKEAPSNDPTSSLPTASDKMLSVAETIAYKAGLEHWDKVNELHFTFNVDRGERHFERSFIWKPKTDDVVYMNQTDTIFYNRNQLDSLSTAADKAFINDKYWLLAPYQLVWDTGTMLSEPKPAVAPMSKDSLQMLTIVYGDEGGYTPGDAYDFYYDDEFIVREWVFRQDNDSLPSMITSWEAYQDYNGLKLATIHRDSTANFKLYFTNISVK